MSVRCEQTTLRIGRIPYGVIFDIRPRAGSVEHELGGKSWRKIRQPGKFTAWASAVAGSQSGRPISGYAGL
jgi:hypothetical protein